MGPFTFGEEEGEVFLGRSMTQHKEVSEEQRNKLMKKCVAIIDRNYQRAKEILVANMEKLHLMAESLIKYETIDAKQIQEIMSGKEPTPPEDWGSSKPLDKVEVIQ